MRIHYWGDPTFDWEAFEQAYDYISREYHRKTNKHPILKEKYGNIVYEMDYVWINFQDAESGDFEAICSTLKSATKKYPTVAYELIEDFLDTVEAMKDTTVGAYHYGYFERIEDEYYIKENSQTHG